MPSPTSKPAQILHYFRVLSNFGRGRFSAAGTFGRRCVVADEYLMRGAMCEQWREHYSWLDDTPKLANRLPVAIGMAFYVFARVDIVLGVAGVGSSSAQGTVGCRMVDTNII